MPKAKKQRLDTTAGWRVVIPSNWCGIASMVINANSEPIAQIPMAGWDSKSYRAIAEIIAAAPLCVALVKRLAESDPETMSSVEIINLAKQATKESNPCS